MQRSNNLADRAARAVRRARASSDELDRGTPTRRHRHRGRLARLTACLLGVDPADVVVLDDPNRRYGGYPGFVITVHDATARCTCSGPVGNAATRSPQP